VGRTEDGIASVTLMDAKARKRLSIQVTSNGTPSIVFFDDKGQPVHQITPPSAQ
jgi:hypothetical protein